MSDERKKRSRAWLKPVIFLAFFCVNVLVAYAPAPLFRREALTSTIPNSQKEVYFRVPVALAYFAVESYRPPNPWDRFEQWMQARHELLMIGRGLGVAFLLILFVASAGLCNSKKAWIATPIIVFVYSLLQGIIATVFIYGFGE
jgi:hypothetical protein